MHANFRSEQNGHWFCDRLHLTAEKAVMLVTKVTNFGEFGYLNSSRIRKIIISLLLSFSRDKLTLL